MFVFLFAVIKSSDDDDETGMKETKKKTHSNLHIQAPNKSALIVLWTNEWQKLYAFHSLSLSRSPCASANVYVSHFHTENCSVNPL